MYYVLAPTNQDLVHHGVLGMKWGVRRYQPYSVVPRGSGEGGKEIGQALEANKKIAKGNAVSAYKNIKDNIQSYNKAQRKIAKGKDKNNKYSEQSKEIKKVLDEAIKQIDAADLVAGEKVISKAINRSQSMSNLAGSVALTVGMNVMRASGIRVPRVMVIPDIPGSMAVDYINRNRGTTAVNYTYKVKAK